MSNRLLFVFICIAFFFCLTGAPFAQEPGVEQGFIYEEEIVPDFKTELQEKEPEPRFITEDILTTKDVEPAVIFYIRNDIDRKFSGLITNLKLEKIYGIIQENKTATVYFDYSYTSLRNKENILYERGKMTFMKFNSGKWFNAELSIYLKDMYPFIVNPDKQREEE